MYTQDGHEYKEKSVGISPQEKPRISMDTTERAAEDVEDKPDDN